MTGARWETLPYNQARLGLWKAGLYVVWILVKLTLILAVLNRDTVDFIYAGF